VGFVALARRGSIRATKPTLAREHFVARTRSASIRATKCSL
jgi:hypothetical protein